MIYTITDEQIKQFNTDRFDDRCQNCAFYPNPDCENAACVEGYLRNNITPLKQEHFSDMSTETLHSLINVMQSEIKNRENDERKKHIDRIRQRYKELSQEAKELGIELR